MNQSATMWMATVAVMLVIYYHLTDWRIATLGVLTGGLLSTWGAHAVFNQPLSFHPEHGVVLMFAWVSAVLLALSSANLRRERLKHSLNVIGIMAHELRTPLATMGLIAQAIRDESNDLNPQNKQRLGELATRADALTRSINHHIDMQMANARYTYLPITTSLICASQLVQKTLADYPFGSKRERQCVQVVEHDDFWFQGSHQQFIQVLNNLIKNAMHSLKSVQSRYDKGDLRIELGQRDKKGRIQLTDQGIGINASQLKLIFDPFFSTSNETGHGLGLAFCKQVVESAHGKIIVRSEPAMGATFTLQLPCRLPPSSDASVP
ncbi:MAG: HAMP domain-containing histidine kinase [Brachymonas sp.]|nr:HAMP domain-containing histidine kinase [Brachymonas sp.]